MVEPKPKLVKCKKGFVRKRGRCVRKSIAKRFRKRGR
jgi:hypothetical protein